MAENGQDARKHRRIGVNLLVKVSAEDLEEFISQYATNISRGGIFIQSRTPHPKGTKIRFEIRLKGGKTVIRGTGVVMWTRQRAPADEKPKPPGMGVKFLELDKPSRAIVKKIVELKEGKRTKPAPKVTVRGSKPEPPTDVPVDVDLPAGDLPPPPAPLTLEEMEEQEAEEAELDEIEVDISVDDFSEPSIDIELEEQEEKPAAAPMGGRIIGIDLGTTNSCAAVVVDGKPVIIPSRKGHSTIPSIVAFTSEGELLVGHAAKDQMELNPQNTVYGAKRLIGRHYSSPATQQLKERFHYEIIEGRNQEAAVKVVGRVLSLQQVAALILKEIRSVASEMLREDVKRAVISVPAYYSENQRQAVREAGSLAGLNVERIVNEPTAAALAYGYRRGLERRVLVYDLGGGTFDASVLDLCQNIYEVVVTGGDSFLGGVDFDNQLADHVVSEFCKQTGFVPDLDRSTVQRLRDAVEVAKCELSAEEKARVQLQFFAKIENQPRDLDIPLDRAKLEQLCGPLIDQSLKVVSEILKKASLKPEQLDDILLVGGQSRMPLIRQRLQQMFGKEPNKRVHPDEAVALGAALLADSLGKIDSVVLIDVLPMSIGIGTHGGGFQPVLAAGVPLPASKTFRMRTYREQQDFMEIAVFQGNSKRVVDNEYLGTIFISDVTPASKGKLTLDVTLALDQEGLLQVSSRETESGKENPTSMAMKDSQESLRLMLGIPREELCQEQIGVPVSLKWRQASDDPKSS